MKRRGRLVVVSEGGMNASEASVNGLLRTQ